MDVVLSAVDPHSPVPLYYQVESDLRLQLAGGRLAPGSVLPTEQALAAHYGVSRHTVRQALGRLVTDGLISRHAGRGTFVMPQRDKTRFYLDRSFSQQMADLGRTARSQLLDVATGTIPPDAPPPLDAVSGARCLRFSRLRYGDDEPIGLQHTTLLTRRCPDFAVHHLAQGSLYEILARQYGLIVAAIEHTITAQVVTDTIAPLLEVDPGAPLLVVYTTTRILAGEIIEHTESQYRADRYEYSTRHTLTA